MSVQYYSAGDNLEDMLPHLPDMIEVVEHKDTIRKHFRPLLYISGPMMSEGHPYDNIGLAIELGEIAYERGWAPIIPHCDVLICIATGNTDRSRYMDVDLAVLSKCSAACFLPFKVQTLPDGTPAGTSEEFDLATELGIPIYNEETLPYVN